MLLCIMFLRNGLCLEKWKWELQILRKLQDQAVFLCTNNTYLNDWIISVLMHMLHVSSVAIFANSIKVNNLWYHLNKKVRSIFINVMYLCTVCVILLPLFQCSVSSEISPHLYYLMMKWLNTQNYLVPV